MRDFERWVGIVRRLDGPDGGTCALDVRHLDRVHSINRTARCAAAWVGPERDRGGLVTARRLARDGVGPDA